MRSPFAIPIKALPRAGALVLSVLLCLMAVAPAAAQPVVSRASGFAVTQPLSSLPPDEGGKPEETDGGPGPGDGQDAGQPGSPGEVPL